MAHGRLRAIGTPGSLKQKFGAGYKVSIVTDPGFIAHAKSEIRNSAPSSILEDDGAGALIYHFPEEFKNEIPPFIKFLDINESGLFKAWGISQTSLEQVFLRIVRLSQEDGMINDEE